MTTKRWFIAALAAAAFAAVPARALEIPLSGEQGVGGGGGTKVGFVDMDRIFQI